MLSCIKRTRSTLIPAKKTNKNKPKSFGNRQIADRRCHLHGKSSFGWGFYPPPPKKIPLCLRDQRSGTL